MSLTISTGLWLLLVLFLGFWLGKSKPNLLGGYP